MDSVVDNYILVDTEIHEDLEHIEQLVFSGTRDIDATAIYRLKREVLEIRRASQPLAEAMERLFVQPHRAIVDRDGSEVMAFFRDVRRPPAQGQRPRRVLRPAALGHPRRLPRADQRRPEQRHAEDLGVGRHRRRADHGRGHLRHELPLHPRARGLDRRSATRSSTTATSSCSRSMVGRLRRPVPRVQAVRLALSDAYGRLPCGGSRTGPGLRNRASGRGDDAGREVDDEHGTEGDAVPDERHQGVRRDEPQQPGDRRVRDDEGDDDPDAPSDPRRGSTGRSSPPRRARRPSTPGWRGRTTAASPSRGRSRGTVRRRSWHRSGSHRE